MCLVQGLDDEWSEDEDQEALTIYEGKRRNRISGEEMMTSLIRYCNVYQTSELIDVHVRKIDMYGRMTMVFLHFYRHSSKKPCLYRPRLILEGGAGRGQTTHLGPALLHHLEHLSVHLLDLSTMFCVATRTPEEACAHVKFFYSNFCNDKSENKNKP